MSFEPLTHVAVALPLWTSLLLLIVALLRGAAPEQLLAGTLFVMALFDLAVDLALPVANPRAAALARVFVDVLLLAAILAVALHANRLYPLCLGAAQIVTLASHFAAAALMLGAQAYRIMQQVPFWLELIIMAAGLCIHMARQRSAQTPVPSWN